MGTKSKLTELVETVLSLNGYYTVEEANKNNETCHIPTSNEPVYKGTVIDNLVVDERGGLHFWAGNMDDDDNAEEIIVDDKDVERVCNEILNLL